MMIIDSVSQTQSQVNATYPPEYEPVVGEYVCSVAGTLYWGETETDCHRAYIGALQVYREHLQRNPANGDIPFMGEPMRPTNDIGPQDCGLQRGIDW
jgi:hypothetical protein